MPTIKMIAGSTHSLCPSLDNTAAITKTKGPLDRIHRNENASSPFALRRISLSSIGASIPTKLTMRGEKQQQSARHDD